MGAVALAVKAYAFWREGRRLAGYGEPWEYVKAIAYELGSSVRSAWIEAVAMHVCFYEGWCKPALVEAALASVEKPVSEVALRVGREHATDKSSGA